MLNIKQSIHYQIQNTSVDRESLKKFKSDEN